MSLDAAPRRAAFRAMHREGCFVLPNPWDIGSAKRLAAHGFKALASTSAGLAWSLGRQDYELTADQVVSHLETLCQATDLPVNADFEDGFASDAEGVAANVRRAVEAGVAGLSIEDRLGRDLHDTATAVTRLRAAREAIDSSGCDVVLVARCEAFLVGRPDLDLVLGRLRAYAAAGADCLYAPGLRELDAIARVVTEAGPLPVNVLLMAGGPDVASLAAVGVRRVSLGGHLAAAAWSGFEAAVTQLRTAGTVPARR